MNEPSVYLDYAATTPVDPEVAGLLAALFGAGGEFANPSSLHVAGRRARALISTAAQQLAALLNCAPERLVWTSGATESNNLAITGAARYRRRRGRHLVSMQTEHKAVSDVLRALEREGFEVSWLAPRPDGRLDLATLREAIRPDTQLVSIMAVNNETGVIQDIDAIGAICRESDILFHVDAAQAVGKIPLDLAVLPVDFVSMTAHKLYGPKGIGALYAAQRPGCHLEPVLYGGGQQHGIRPGTLPVPLIASFGRAAAIAADRLQQDLVHLRALRERLWQGLSGVPGTRLNGALEHSFPGILNVSVREIEGESLRLAMEPVCVASGSACNSQNQEPSSVLRALGLSDAEAQSAIRFSYGRPTTHDEIDFAVQRYLAAVDFLRKLAP